MNKDDRRGMHAFGMCTSFCYHKDVRRSLAHVVTFQQIQIRGDACPGGHIGAGKCMQVRKSYMEGGLTDYTRYCILSVPSQIVQLVYILRRGWNEGKGKA